MKGWLKSVSVFAWLEKKGFSFYSNRGLRLARRAVLSATAPVCIQALDANWRDVEKGVQGKHSPPRGAAKRWPEASFGAAETVVCDGFAKTSSPQRFRGGYIIMQELGHSMPFSEASVPASATTG